MSATDTWAPLAPRIGQGYVHQGADADTVRVWTVGGWTDVFTLPARNAACSVAYGGGRLRIHYEDGEGAIHEHWADMPGEVL